MDFVPFPKIPRLNRDIVITEKIDGTNASVLVPEDDWDPVVPASRSRWIMPGKQTDSHGFAAYVAEHEETFRALGPGQHFGEWWGQGIQRGYGLDHKRFSLFNTGRWNDGNVPEGLHVVPVLYEGPLNQGLFSATEYALWKLQNWGSFAAPEFFNPEGIVVYHTAAGQYFKATLVGDEKPKGAAA